MVQSDFAFPLSLLCIFLHKFKPPSVFTLSGVERGKIQNITQECQYVSFSSSYSSGTPVRVFASVNHGDQSSQVHDSAFVWVEDVTTSRFKACLETGCQGFGGNNTIDWFAFQGSQSGVEHGQTSFTPFTTGTKCNQVTFSRVRSYFFVVVGTFQKDFFP